MCLWRALENWAHHRSAVELAAVESAIGHEIEHPDLAMIEITTMTLKKLLVHAALVCAALATGSSFAAEIECVEEADSATIHIRGLLNKGDAAIFERCAQRIFSKGKIYTGVILNSKGGMVSEAMRIGRELRKRKLSAWVTDEKECLSACVFILAGATERVAYGRIGIHRPYFTKPPEKSYDATFKAMLKDAKAYFSEMNIPEVLAEDMFSIRPDEMRVLDKQALNAYRLSGDDMAFSEEREMAKAESLGMSRQEYMMRKDIESKYAELCQAQHPNPQSIDATLGCLIEAQKKAGLKP